MRKGFMKKAVGVALAAAMAFTVLAPVKAEAKESDNAVYAITSIKGYTMDTSDNKLKLDYSSTYKVNKKGQVTKSTFKSYSDINNETYQRVFSSKPISTVNGTFKYKNGLKIKETYSDGSKYIYTYDKNKRIKTFKYYDNGKLNSTTTNTYSKGNLKKVVNKNADGTQREYTYDSNGHQKYSKYWNTKTKQLLEENFCDKHGSYKKTIYYNEDNTKNVTTYVNTYKKGELAKQVSKQEYSTTTYEYYTSGYRKGYMKKYTFDTEYSKHEETYEYKPDKSKKNVAVSIVKNKDGQVIRKTEYKYKKIK